MKGLSFSEPMMKAWLEGWKTVTRRLMNPQPEFGISECHYSGTGWAYENEKGICTCVPAKPRYRPGETVYIKEVWGIGDHGRLIDPCLNYKADGKQIPIIHRAKNVWSVGNFSFGDDYLLKIKSGWRPPRFMPEWASRSKARIVSVRPERVQEITTREIIREGYPVPKMPDISEEDKAIIKNCAAPDLALSVHPAMQLKITPPKEWFRGLWESLHPGSWDLNPWVWRIELEKI